MLMQINPQAALALLEEKDQETIRKLKEFGIGLNFCKLREQVLKIEHLHRRICGVDCIHLKRYYKFLKNQNSKERIPIPMATRRFGFFS